MPSSPLKKKGWSSSEREKRRKKCDNPKGFTMKQFCKNQSTKSKKGEKLNSPKKEFKFNKNDPKKSFDVYIDKNPSDTIPIKYKTISDVKSTIRKLEKLYKEGKYPHKRIKQVSMIMMVRLRFIDGKKGEYNLAERYHDFLGERTKTKGDDARKKMRFKI